MILVKKETNIFKTGSDVSKDPEEQSQILEKSENWLIR